MCVNFFQFMDRGIHKNDVHILFKSRSALSCRVVSSFAMLCSFCGIIIQIDKNKNGMEDISTPFLLIEVDVYCFTNLVSIRFLLSIFTSI